MFEKHLVFQGFGAGVFETSRTYRRADEEQIHNRSCICSDDLRVAFDTETLKTVKRNRRKWGVDLFGRP